MSAPDRCTFRGFAGGILALSLTLVIAGSGCSNNSPTGPDFGANDPSVVVALGDSITFGVLDTNVETCEESNRGAGGFCPPLQSLSGKSVINAGLCGQDSYGGVAHVDQALHRWRPGVILIDYSPNDIANGSEVLISNLRFMIAAAIANQTIPVLGTLVPATGYHEGWNPFIVEANTKIRALCVELKLECADHYLAFVTDPGFIASPFALLSEEGLHPNHAGYALMAETWAETLRRVY